MYRFSISYKDLEKNDIFLRGENINLNTRDIIYAVKEFYKNHPNTHQIEGIIVTYIDDLNTDREWVKSLYEIENMN